MNPDASPLPKRRQASSFSVSYQASEEGSESSLHFTAHSSEDKLTVDAPGSRLSQAKTRRVPPSASSLPEPSASSLGPDVSSVSGSSSSSSSFSATPSMSPIPVNPSPNPSPSPGPFPPMVFSFAPLTAVVSKQVLKVSNFTAESLRLANEAIAKQADKMYNPPPQAQQLDDDSSGTHGDSLLTHHPPPPKATLPPAMDQLFTHLGIDILQSADGSLSLLRPGFTPSPDILPIRRTLPGATIRRLQVAPQALTPAELLHVCGELIFPPPPPTSTPIPPTLHPLHPQLSLVEEEEDEEGEESGESPSQSGGEEGQAQAEEKSKSEERWTIPQAADSGDASSASGAKPAVCFSLEVICPTPTTEHAPSSLESVTDKDEDEEAEEDFQETLSQASEESQKGKAIFDLSEDEAEAEAEGVNGEIEEKEPDSDVEAVGNCTKNGAGTSDEEGATSLPPLSAVTHQVDSFLHGSSSAKSLLEVAKAQQTRSDPLLFMSREMSTSTPSLLSVASVATSASSSSASCSADSSASVTAEESAWGASGGAADPSAPVVARRGSSGHPGPSSSSGGHAHKRRPSTLLQISTPSYRSKIDDFRAIFASQGVDVEGQTLLADFSCAYFKSILIQGRMYITQGYFAFYANWVGLYEKWNIIKISDVKSLVKANTMLLIPNAIHICTADGEKHIYASFAYRDRAHEVMSTVWRASSTSPSQMAPSSSPRRLSSSGASQAASQASAVLSPATGTSNPTVMIPLLYSVPTVTPTGGQSTNGSNEKQQASASSFQPEASQLASPSASSLSQSVMWSIVKEMYGKNLGLTEEEEASLAGGAAIARGGAGAGEFELETLEESEEALLASSSFPALAEEPEPASILPVPPKRHRRTPSRGSISSASNLVLGLEPSPSGASNGPSSVPSILPTTTKSSEPSQCACVNAHYGTLILDRTFPLPLDKLTALLLQPGTVKSELILERYLRSRGTTDLQLDDWSPLDSSACTELSAACKAQGSYPNLWTLFEPGTVKCRTLQYTVQLNHRLAKAAFTQEKVYMLQNAPGSALVLHSVAKNEGPPFSDCFVISSTWCLTRAQPGTPPGTAPASRLQIHYKLSWIKSSFGLSFLKGTIEENSRTGITESMGAKVRWLEMELGLVEPDGAFLKFSKACGGQARARSASNGTVRSLEGATGSRSGSIASEGPKIGSEPLLEASECPQADALGVPFSGPRAGDPAAPVSPDSGRQFELRLFRYLVLALLLLVLLNGFFAFRLYRLEGQVQELARTAVQIVQQARGEAPMAPDCGDGAQCLPQPKTEL